MTSPVRLLGFRAGNLWDILLSTIKKETANDRPGTRSATFRQIRNEGKKAQTNHRIDTADVCFGEFADLL